MIAVLTALALTCAPALTQTDPARTASACILRQLPSHDTPRSVPAPPVRSPLLVADLVATGLTLTTSAGGDTLIPAPLVGDDVYINFFFQNSGSTNAKNFTIEIIVDGYIYCSFAGQIDAAPGSEWVLSCPGAWQPTAGLHQLVGRVDASNIIAESNESNNLAYRIVPVPIVLSGSTHGDPPGSSESDVWFSARHKEAVATWFTIPTSGLLDTLWWVMGDSIGAKDSTVIVSLRRSRVSWSNGAG
jgi:hypothetical protein